MAEPAELDAVIEPSGPPSCMQCAVLIAADERVDAIWLYHRAGVRIAQPNPEVDPSPGRAHPLGGPAGWLEIPAGWRRWAADEFLLETMAQNQIPPRSPSSRGTPDWPCEDCGNASTGSTRDGKGFMRCNVCGYPSP